MPNLLGNSLLDFKNHRSLRTLKLDATNLFTGLRKGAGPLKKLLSLIKSPQLDVVLIYRGGHLSLDCPSLSEYDEESGEYINKPEREYVYGCQGCQRQWGWLFGVLGEVQRAREFRLVLCVGGDGEDEDIVEDAKRALEHCVELHQCEELDPLLSDSLITSVIPRWDYDIYDITKAEL